MKILKIKKIVIISDEAHHINAWTKNKLGKEETIAKTTWEYTVNSIFNSNTENIMLEYTVTVDLDHPAIYEVKGNIKNTDFWKEGFIFINRRVEVDRSKIRDIDDIDVSKNFGPYNLRTGFTHDRAIFGEEIKPEEDRTTKGFELKSFNKAILRKALSKLDFYKFDNFIYFLLVKLRKGNMDILLQKSKLNVC